MSIQKAYDSWASQYDTNVNKTRDIEAIAIRQILTPLKFHSVLEIGCGTGKNTEWFAERASRVTAIDFSDEMLAMARAKITSKNVEFKQADITTPWTFREQLYDLVSFSLVLEHMNNLEPIFREAAESLADDGHIYIGELHPFKQYTGSKARYATAEGEQVVDCYNHHLSDFIQAAKKYGLKIADVSEFFDDDERKQLPRILSILFIKG